MKTTFIYFFILLFRRSTEERNRKIAEQSAEKAKQSSDRAEFKKKESEKVCRKERERQEKAEEWKYARVEAMKTRREQHEEMDKSYEKAAQEYQSNKEVSVESCVYSLARQGRQAREDERETNKLYN